MADTLTVQSIPVEDITLLPRHRQDMGDLDALAQSIDRLGLLHPIGVTAENVLIFGERRLRAVRDILKQETIPAIVLDLPALEAEHDENEVRKDFTPSERVAIAQAIRIRFGERRGRPAQAREEKDAEEIVEKIPQFEPFPGEKTRQAVARAAGFGNETTLRQAEKVVEQGTPELVEAMDDETVSIAAAAQVADLPPQTQQAVVKEIKKGKKAGTVIAKAKATAKPKAQDGPVDAWGIPIQPHAEEAFAALPKFQELLNTIRQAQRLFNELANMPGGSFLQLPAVSSYRRGKKQDNGEHEDRFVHEGLERAYQQVKVSVPTHTVCPWHYVDTPHPEKCNTCLGLNWTPALGSGIPQSAIDRAREAHDVCK